MMSKGGTGGKGTAPRARGAGVGGKHRAWERKAGEISGVRDISFDTISGVPLKLMYTPSDVEGVDYERDLGYPGEYPYTRGVHPNMYRGRLWTMRQFSGFGTARDTNRRYHFLLKGGQTGLSVAFDLPTLMGCDSDDPRSLGEVGRCGVAIDSLEDMEVLFDGITLDKVSTSMTINSPASMLLAYYIAVGEKQGVGAEKLRGTLQNDILKEYIAQKEFIFPPEPSVKIITDIMEFCTQHVPQWNTISISGYHIREAGATAAQELAFTLADGMAYVEAAIAAGQKVDDFAPRLSFFFDSHLDFFEEIAKFRAARVIWARAMREKYGALKPESLRLRFHTQTAGVSLTAQQPENNITRTALEALAGVLGGTQSLHTNSMDETYALPTEKAVQIALRTQQLIAFESGVANVIDPLGGSYFIENLTRSMIEQAEEYFEKIEERGGVIAAIEAGFFQKEIARAAYRYQKEIETRRRIIVGINEYLIDEEEPEIPILEIDAEVEKEQAKRVRDLRERRDNDLAGRRLKELTETAKAGRNVMPTILDASRAYCTIGEMVKALEVVYGRYRESPAF
jgi:methylmalonyl-CoA mutase N-terminal domain/subunit